MRGGASGGWGWLARIFLVGWIGTGFAGAAPPIGIVVDGGATDVRVSGTAWALVTVDAANPDASNAAIAELRAEGWLVAACLAPSALPRPDAPGAIEAWSDLVRTATLRLAPDAIGVGCAWDPSWDAETYAFALKRSALAVRVAARELGREVLVASAAIDAADGAARARLWAQDIAPYVDAIVVSIPPGMDPAPVVATVTQETVAHPPAPRVFTIHRADAADPWAAAASALRALAAGATTAVWEPGRDALAAARWSASVGDALGRHLPAPVGDARLVPAPGSTASGEILGRFFDNDSFTSLVFYRGRVTSPGTDARLHLVLRGAVSDARLVDLVTGETKRVPTTGVTGETSARALVLPAAPAAPADPAGRGVGDEASLPLGTPSSDDDARSSPPLAVRFRIAVPGGDRKEELAVGRTRSLTAEEIIARHQEVRAAQDEHLERWTAQGRIDLHFRFEQAGDTIDVSIDSNYFWKRGGELEWEQTAYWVNGNRVRWKNIPELPLIQPEKVVTLPLDLHLDKTYAYRLLGEERVDGKPAWILAFEPIDPGATASLYRGRVWIDQTGFERLKLALLQTELEPPVVSNEEVDSFEAHAGPDGRRYNMLTRTDGQQIWSTAGRSFVVHREVTFHEFEINPSAEEFDARLAAAYASSNQMLRDTARGFRYLERVEGGERQVKETVDTSQLFAAAGAFGDSSSDGVRPIAGVNWFDYDLGGKNVQLNALFGGVIAFVTVSKPGLVAGRVDGTVDVTASALAFDDTVYRGDDELVEERVEVRTQRAALRLGVPVGAFFKVDLVGSFAHRSYSEDDEAEDVLARANDANPAIELDYELPADHLQSTAAIEIDWHRRGLFAGARYAVSRRSEWERFGLRDLAVSEDAAVAIVDGAVVPVERAPLEDDFAQWGASFGTQWFLPRFQKLRGEIDVMDGDRLDRFSQYQFGMFGDDRLSGFSGSGVRFDRGAIARGGYSFNLFEAIRFDATVETARVELEAPGSEAESHTGVGLGGNVVGPWKTVFQVSWGYALASDVPDLEGEQEFFLLVLKLF
jgi:hypothetical protein